MDSTAPARLDLVKIGYYDPFGIYPRIQNDISKRLPLTNLHVRFKSNQLMKTIPKLDVEFVEEVPKKADYHHHLTTHDIKTYVRLIFVQVDSLDKYRGQVRPLIREWLKNLVLRTNDCSWMIVLYVPLDGKDRLSSIIKSSFFDKLMNDFGPEGKEMKTILPGHNSSSSSGTSIARAGSSDNMERVFKLKQVLDEDLFASFMIQLRQLLLSAFVDRYHMFNDLIHKRKSNGIKSLAAKLELYNLLKDMKLLQDALVVNEELLVDLDNLVSHNPGQFNHELQLNASSLTNFKFNEFINEENLKQQLINSDEEINLVQLKSLIFANESYILQELARTAVSNSLASKHISRLYQRLMLFLNDSHFNNSHEFVYLLIDSFLRIPIVHQLLNAVNDNNDAGGIGRDGDGDVVPLIDVLEMQAELKLFKRTVIGKIAKLNGIEIDGLRGNCTFEEVNLNDDTTQVSSIQSTLTNHQLMEIVKNEQSFVDYYFNLTEDIIGDFVKCNRVKSIDILSLDLAILNYNQGNYQECLDTLQNSYDYFIMNSWNFLGGVLLEIYLGCVEKLRDKSKKSGEDGVDGGDAEVLRTCLNLLACLVKRDGDCVGINSYKLVRNAKHVAQLFNKIDENCGEGLSEPLLYPLNHFFKAKVKPFVNANDATPGDEYFIEVEVYNLFNVPLKFTSMGVTLMDDTQTQLSFKADDILLSASPEVQIFKLYTRDIKFGLFAIHRLMIAYNDKLSFIHEYSNNDNDDDDGGVVAVPDNSIFNETVVEHKHTTNSNSALSNDVLIFQNVYKFQAQFVASKVVELGTNAVSLVLKTGSNDVSNIEIRLSSNTDGVQLSQPHLTIDKLDAKQKQTLQIPYTFFNDLKLINMQAHVSYLADDVTYTAQVSYNVDTRLAISVSVQDVFKTQFFYSKFQVGTADAKSPIRLVLQNLVSDDYEIKLPSGELRNLVAFGEQPITFFYKITPRVGHAIDDEDKLDLSLCYTNLQDECEQQLTEIVWDSLSNSNGGGHLIHYWYLIKETILSKVQFDLNKYAVQNVLQIVNAGFVQSFADRVIGRYVEHESDQVQLHKNFVNLAPGGCIAMHPSCKLDKLDTIQHQLNIKVAVPILKYLHVVEYVYERKTYIVGESIPVTLRIKTVTKWSDGKQVLAVSSPSRSTTNANDNDTEVIAPPSLSNAEKFQAMIQPDDNWLVSGFKKQTISSPGVEASDVSEAGDANDDAPPFQTSLVLIPLHVGKLYLPKIVVSPIENGTSGGVGATSQSDIEFVNGCETIMSVPDVRNIQFSF